MDITLDDDLAEDMTRGQFERESAAAPDQNDFYYEITRAGTTFDVRWSRDIGVSDPKWHIIVSKV
ncbi:MAG: hypothetical protein EOO20_22165 [Chryseobacterium sp.]|nr:MAG: hypothetical protein EOO20_22165 [Chryseobacterium sp.]